MTSGKVRTTGLLLVSLLVLDSAGIAQTAVPHWTHSFRPPGSGTVNPNVIAARELADGTRLAVTDDLVSFHFDANGNSLSAVQLPREFRGPGKSSRRPEAGNLPEGYYQYPSFAAIDAFGAVVLARAVSPDFYSTDIQTMKYDGLTGRGLWPSPAVSDPSGLLGDDFPTGVFLDPSGDVVVTGLSPLGSPYRHMTYKYDGRSGELLWGPVFIDGANGAGTAAVDRNGNIHVSVARPSPGSDGRYRLATYFYSGQHGDVSWGPAVVDGEGYEYPEACAVDAQGNAFVAGVSDDLFTVRKYGFNGSVLWTARLDPIPGNGESEATSVVLDAAGDVLVTGMAGPRYATYKLAGGTGAVLWGPSLTDAGSNPQATKLAIFGNGDALVESIRTTASETHLQFQRLRRADGATVFGPVSVGQVDSYAPSGPFFVAANGRFFGVDLFTDGSASTRAFEAGGQTGELAWGPTPMSLPSQGVGYLIDLAGGPDGSIGVTGIDSVNASTLTFKYDRTTGNLDWGPVSYGSSDEPAYPYQTAVDTAGNVYVMGTSTGTYVIKYAAASGSVVWGPTVIPDMSPTRMALDPAGNPVVTGYVFGATSYVTRTARISGASGAVLWAATYDSGSGFDDYPRALAADAAGNALVVGQSYDSNGYHWFVIKYAAANGSVAWGPIMDPSGSPYAVAVDSVGDVIATGASGDPDYQMTTYKFSGSSGAVLWGPVTLDGSSDYAEGRALVLDANGDVFVGGNAYTDASTDFATLKYGGSDGARLWGPVFFDGEAHRNDYVYDLGLGVDVSGNVVVGGTSRRGRDYDAALLKYDGGTGATLWGPVYAGDSNDDRLYGFSALGDSVVIGLLNYGSIVSVGFAESFGMTSLTHDLAPAFCGQPYSVAFGAANGVLPYAFSIAAGAPPAGLILSSTGILSGIPDGEGLFTFTVRAHDAASATADREVSIFVGPAEDPFRAIYAYPGNDTCHLTLVFPGTFASYFWLPGGETTPQIEVAPIETTTYGVIVSDGSGCLLRHSLTVEGTMLQNPDCQAPAISSVSPGGGPASDATPITVAGANFLNGAQVILGGVEAGGVAVFDPTLITATSPALAPGKLYSVVVVNPDTGSAALPGAWFADFLDVPAADPFHDSVVTVVRNGVSAGCGGGNYCPTNPVTRAQMAVFLLRSLLGATYVPPPATGLFADVPAFDPFAPWIEKLYDLGVTAGCGGGLYCPSDAVTRAQMAVFLLKTHNGSQYTPPPAYGIFDDVPVSDPFAPWIENLYNWGITGGCSVAPPLYCPASAVNRGQMAVFLVKMFHLQ